MFGSNEFEVIFIRPADDCGFELSYGLDFLIEVAESVHAEADAKPMLTLVR